MTAGTTPATPMDALPLKLIEGLLLLAGLALFVWWQMRDLERAREQTARERAAREAAASGAAGTPGRGDTADAQRPGGPPPPPGPV